jgi:PiT family inorganic phosphate transporter
MFNLAGLDPLLVAFVATALCFNFISGYNNSANIVATVISSRAMRPRGALLMSSLAHLVSPFLFGVAVATTVGNEVVAPRATTLPVVWAALLGSIAWNLLTGALGVPSSSSHSLVGGLVGAAAAGHGFDALLAPGLLKILLILLTSPLLGLLGGYLLTKAVYYVARGASPGINQLFKRGQILTALALALSHSTNAAQKTMGIIAMGLLAGGALATFRVPFWVVAASAATLALGTSLGGWRIIRTLGGKFYKIRPIHSFTSQLASAVIILGAALIGGPVSTTHIVSTTILSAGAAERVNQVRWGVMRQIVAAWVLTIPASALVAGLVYYLLEGSI